MIRTKLLIIVTCWFAVLGLGSPADAGTVLERSLVSELRSEPLEYRIYLPSALPDDGPRSAILLLHGYGGSSKDWLGGGQAAATLERMIEEGSVPPTILVMPSANNSWYVTSDRFGPIDQVILHELTQTLEAEFEIDRWAIAGLSMGGYGALRLGLLQPDCFRFIGALSPAIFKPDFEHGKTQLNLFGRVFGDPFDAERYERSNPFLLLDQPTIPPIYLSVGDDDYFKLDIGALEFYLAAKAQNHTIELRVLNAGHTWPLWQSEFEAMLRDMGKFLTSDDDRAGK